MKPSTLLYLPLTFVSIVTAADPRLVLVANISINVGPGFPSGVTPQGQYLYVSVASGTFNTTDPVPLRARFVAGSGDYAQIRADGSTGVALQGGFQDINSSDFFRYTANGFIQSLGTLGSQSPGSLSTAYGQIDAYQTIRINTNSTRYGWLNAAALVGQERIVLVNGNFQAIELKVFRVLVKDNQTAFDPN